MDKTGALAPHVVLSVYERPLLTCWGAGGSSKLVGTARVSLAECLSATVPLSYIYIHIYIYVYM
jgi:hypothetical protein